MDEIEATYRITTPMFCAGAKQQRAEFRVPSFKGVLRFWWRTLAWSAVCSVTELRRKEALLFGSTDRMAPWRMRMVGAPGGATLQKGETLKDGSSRLGVGASYLGYGAVQPQKKGGRLERGCLRAPAEVTIGLRLRPAARSTLTDEDHQRLVRALELLGLVGSMGSKARKGYGSMTLTRLVLDGREQSLCDDPGHAISAVLGPLSGGEPEWTAWSQDSRVVLVRPANEGVTPLRLLDCIGREMVRYRGGRLPSGEAPEPNFTSDRELMRTPGPKHAHPRRIAFGLPHSYFYADSGRDPKVKPVRGDRRASPLFIHVHQRTGDARPVGVVSFLPSRFLPENEVEVDSSRVPVDTADLWNPIHGFLERLTNGCREPIAGEEIRLG